MKRILPTSCTEVFGSEASFVLGAAEHSTARAENEESGLIGKSVQLFLFRIAKNLTLYICTNVTNSGTKKGFQTIMMNPRKDQGDSLYLIGYLIPMSRMKRDCRA